jgi:hypothetical protein
VPHFVPLGYASIEQALNKLCSQLGTDRPSSIQTLRRALHSGALAFKIQMRKTGELTSHDRQMWGATVAEMWIENDGEIYILDGGAETIRTNATDHWEPPSGEYGDFLVVEESLRAFLLTSARTALRNRNNEPRRYSLAEARTKFGEWRAHRGDNIPTEKEDIAHMKQFNVPRDLVRKLRRTVPRLKRGKPRRS